MNSLLGHIRWLFRSRRNRQLDERAMAIADKYGMRKQYLEARKFGYTPLEALEDWDMILPSEKELFNSNNMKNEDFQKTNTILTLVLTIFSLIALILSWISFHNSSNITEKINSVEFQISKEVRYQMIELVCALRSIDTKAAVAPHINEKIDYSEEREVLSKIQRSPSYHTYLLSIKDKDDRLLFDMRIRLLSESLLVLDNESSYEIRNWVHLILDHFVEGTDLEEAMQMKYNDMLVNLCKMEGVYSAFTPMPDEPNIIADFTEYLIVEKRVNDPDVLLLNGAYNNDAEVMEKALDAGANRNVTSEMLIEKYSVEYDEFIKKIR